MTILQRIAREPNALAGVVISAYSVLVAFGVLELTVLQTSAIGGFAGAIVFGLRWLTTPAAEVVAQKSPGQIVPTAGPASDIDTGAPVHLREILGKA